MAVVELSDRNFEQEVLRSKVPVIVDFWAEWCMPCRMLTPIFKEASEHFKGRVKFAKLHTIDYPQYAQEYRIDGIPCMIVFENGKEKDRIIGMMPANALKRQIENIIS